MENNNQKQQQHDNSDSMKLSSTNSGGNDETPSTSSSTKDIIHDDVCSICFDDVSMSLDITTYFQCTQCGKVMHMKCAERLTDTKGLSRETRTSCPMCRAPFAALGSKEDVERLQKWSLLNRPWAQFSLGNLYACGLGANDTVCALYLPKASVPEEEIGELTVINVLSDMDAPSMLTVVPDNQGAPSCVIEKEAPLFERDSSRLVAAT